MSKRLSTLLAAALVAGGLSSFAAEAEKSLTLNPKKYYQICKMDGENMDATIGRLIIGHSEDGKRDSLVFVKAEEIKRYEDFNATLWKPTVTQKVDEAGHVYYALSFVDKEGQAMNISTENVKPSQTSFYKAQYAYMGTDGISEINLKEGVEIDEKGNVTMTGLVDPRTNVYDAESKKLLQYALVVKDNAVKVMVAEGAPSENVGVEPKDGAIEKLYLLELTEENLSDPSFPWNPYKLSASDLTKDVDSDSFELTFSNDVKNSTIGNLFSEHKLKAVPFESMWSAAVYKTDYAEASAKAKKSLADAFAEMKPAYAAWKAEQNTAIAAAKANKAASAGKLVDLAVNKTDLDASLTEWAGIKLKYLRSLESKDHPALMNKLDSVNHYFDLIELESGKVLAKDNDGLKDYEDVVKRADEMLKDIEDQAALAFHVVDSVMAVAMSNPYNTVADFKATFKDGREKENLTRFASSGFESLQRNF